MNEAIACIGSSAKKSLAAKGNKYFKVLQEKLL
jgi:hypothetical protein